MELTLILGLVLVLYVRTLTYNYVIDDNVKRGGYLYDVPLAPPPYEFYCTKPSKWYRMFMIAMHCVNVSVVYLLWGWAPALIFAVHPMSVWGVAWVTGNYYATAAYFTLIAYFILHQFPNIFGALIAMPIFVAALNSTVCPINFPFFASVALFPFGLAFLLPLATFIFGKRFQTGIAIRLDLRKDPVVNLKFTPARLYCMVIVVGRYTFDAIFPGRCGFFSALGHGVRDSQAAYDKLHTPTKEFWHSLALIVAVLVFGLIVSPVGIMWFFVIITLHSQWNMTGQFYAQRYLYLPLVGMCVVLGSSLGTNPVVITAYVTYLVIRTNLFIPAWRNQGEVLRNDIDNYPDNAQVYNSYAQWLMCSGKPLNNTEMNELAMNLFKSEAMDEKAWETQMNIAAFFALMSQWKECYRRTMLSIEYLKPLGGVSNPMEALLTQKANVEKILNEIALKEAGKKDNPSITMGSK